MHERAVDAAMEIECKKDRLAQNQDGTWKLTLTVAPDGLSDAMMKAFPGVRYRAFFVEVDDNEEPVKPSPAAPEKNTVPFYDHELSWQAGVRCNDAQFQEFLKKAHPNAWHNALEDDDTFPTDKDIAAQTVRMLCGVSSRSEILPPNSASLRWREINAKFEEWNGQRAEAR